MKWNRALLASAILAALSVSACEAVPEASRTGAWDRNFYWGTATAGYQVEGDAPDSNWRRYVSRVADKPVTPDSDPLGAGPVDPYQQAVDFRHRYHEDITNAHAMGVNTSRLGIEWARVMPEPGKWDERELAYYDDVLATLRKNGMTPMITLMHWVYPGWIADRGGFMNNVAAFQDFARAITKRYAGQGVLWVSVNEPVVFGAMEVRTGAVKPDQFDAFLGRVADAHRAVYRAAHDADPDAKVTTNEAYISPEVLAQFAGLGIDGSFFDRVKDSLDYLGFDYYTGTARDNPASAQSLTARWNTKLQAEDIYYVARHYAQRYPGLPIYVVENGMVTDDGKPRSDKVTRSQYLEDTVFWMQRAKADGIPIIGYNYWSLVDNYEWGSYRPRFGLYTVDALNDPELKRIPTDAVATYTQITRDGGTVNGYRPALPAAHCSTTVGKDSCEPLDPDGPLAELK
ncbi:family 1 glycosylhydrolase [Mycolicibacterium fortuitum]|uniref:family 1 glycosylhydrolase n=1 Tax=Mycolicibacterium fortuitum TaxID=1766 RepID=UPI0007ECA5BD|nr:family 1 glycosylhydrolase [Mycolicibacterium fortuitum]NOQ60860.1 glycoside hydrolase family 1 protein [Mycolicibacterium fortuitum]OBI66862.1 glycoside hydrolase family 1 [Mycolicibacterium fortuitum]